MMHKQMSKLGKQLTLFCGRLKQGLPQQTEFSKSMDSHPLISSQSLWS
jgi:hypothetical protein